MVSRELSSGPVTPATSPTFISVAVLVGALLGLFVELVAQPLLYLRDAEAAGIRLSFPWLQVAFVPLISAAALAAVGGLAALPVSGLLRGRLRAFALAFVALALALALGAHAMGLSVRYASGLYPTSSAITLFLESPYQFMDQVEDSYPHALPWAVVALLAAWAGISAVLAQALRRSTRWSPRPLFVAPAAAFVGATALCAPVVAMTLREHALETVEISLYASMLEPADAEAVDSSKIEAAVAELEGPPRSERADHGAALQELRKAPEWAELPNVLLIMLESVPQSRMGYAGYRRRSVTPNLDRIAAASLRSMRTWSTSTHSSYAQMAVLSSLFPRRGTRLDTYRHIDYPRSLPQDLLRPLGYDTATFSSQNEDWQGMRRFQKTPTPHLFFDTHSYSGPKMGPTRGSKVPDDATTSAAIDWLERPRRHPFYLYLNLQQTHWPYRLPPGARAKFPGPSIQELRDRGLAVGFMRVDPEAREAVSLAFDSALWFVDSQVGRVFEALERLGELDDTLVVITADHGESFGEAGIDAHGKTLREPEARPPLLVHYPKRVPPGEIDVPISHLDIMPTVLDVLGLPPYPGYQGRSFLDSAAFSGERRAVFLTMQGLRQADGVVCYPWKLVHDRSQRLEQLYQLEHDVEERRNLALVRPDVRRSLELLLATQVSAQLGYHARSRRGEEQRFAPRLARCPELPLR